MKRIIGIIGGGASGKTFAGKFFASLGAGFIDCDQIVGELYDENGLGTRKIAEFFGDEFIKNSKVNRAKLGRFIAKNEKKLRILEKIMHPIVLSELQKKIDKSQKELIFVEIGAPGEKFMNLCEKTIEIQAKNRKIKKKYLQQIDKFKKLPKADITIQNTFDKKSFEEKLLKTYNQLI
ncbi:MAG: dephospho-CoA kinase [Patescibacteria group bacterium]|nr:dephospho-CoA kinase [Patescibacteria group bacterium]